MNYTKRVSYSFEVDDIRFAIVDWSWPCSCGGLNDQDNVDWVFIEELSKNGQEDTHIYLEADKFKDGWEIDRDEACTAIYYLGEDIVHSVEKYLNDNPFTPEKE